MHKKILSEKRTVWKRPIGNIENETYLLKIRITNLDDGFAVGHISAEVLNNTSSCCTQEIASCRQYLGTAVDLLSDIALYFIKWLKCLSGDICSVQRGRSDILNTRKGFQPTKNPGNYSTI